MLQLSELIKKICSNLFVFSRSIVLMGTRGQPEGLVGLAPYLVSFGLAKAPELHSKGQWHTHFASCVCPVTIFHTSLSHTHFISASHHRESGTLGLPGWFFTSFVGFTKSWKWGWHPGAAGALFASGFGGIWLFTTCSSNTQRPGASEKSHRTTINNVNSTTCLPKNLLHTDKDTQPADECELLNL